MTEQKGIVRPGKVLDYAGAFIALLIGSGFATGQEILQYFSSWGYWGIAGVILMFLLMAYVGISFVSTGFRERFDNPNDIYRYYCGNALGTFYDYFSVFFLFLSYMVMVAGAGATVEQHYSMDPYLGSLALVVLTLVTVTFGLNRIVDVIGKIGPIIVAMTLVVGLTAIARHIDRAPQALELMKQLIAEGVVKVASTSWWLAVGSYVGFCMLWLAAFLAQIGKSAASDREGRTGAFFGALGFALACLVAALGILFGISLIAAEGGAQIPSLILAHDISPAFAHIFALTIFAGIYTTAVPLLWTVVARFSKERTGRFYTLTLLLGIIGGIIGLSLRFDVLVNYVYVLNGYVGLLLLAIMMFRSLQWRRI